MSDPNSEMLDAELDSSEGEQSGTFQTRDLRERQEALASAAVEIVNRTARRIRVERRGGEGLVLGPFGLLRTTQAVIDELELRLWLERGYVVTREPRVGEQPPVEPTTVAGALLIVGATIIVQAIVTRTWLPTVIGAVLFALTILPEFTRWLEWRRKADAAPLSAVVGRARDRFWHGLGMLVVCVTGFGLPIGVMFIQSGLPLAALREQPLRAMGFLGLFSCFVGSAATLPAMLFFLFSEQRRDVMRAQFHRDILRLDPALRTVGETERAYAPLLSEALCMRRGPLFFGPIVLSTFLLALGWVVAVLPTHADIQRALAPLETGAGSRSPIELCALFVPNPTAFTFAFLGTYFFALNMVFRRYVRADLGPKAYSHIAVRIIIATVLAWVASQTWEGLRDPASAAAATVTGAAPAVDGVSPWHLLLLAFFIGFVPETGLTVLYGVLKNRWVSAVIPALSNRDPLTRLEGITLYDQARLLEEGIENIENLCHHNLIELLLRTRIPAPRLVDLVDQGILYLHARDATDGTAADDDGGSSRTLAKLKSLGVRTATDFEQTFRHHTARVALMHAFGDDAPRLRLIAFALEDDEWMPQLRSWREFRRTYETIYTAAELEKTGAPRSPGISIPPLESSNPLPSEP